MKSILMTFALAVAFIPSFVMAACEVVTRDGKSTVVASDGGKCLKGEPLHGASSRMSDMVLAGERFCESPKAEYIEEVKKDGVFARRFHLQCAYAGRDSSPVGLVKGDIVFLR